MSEQKLVWFVTGCSKGLGQAIMLEVLEAGHKVFATSRSIDSLSAIVDNYPDQLAVGAIYLRNGAEIAAAVDDAISRFGKIDVLVNNAGYGYLGALEEGVEKDFQELLETNLIAPLNLSKAVLPGMRERRAGHIINITSIGGIVSYPGVGYYNTVKAGLEALSDAMAQEVLSLGIKVTAVAPGAFRTDFRGDSIRMAPLEIDDYNETAGAAREKVKAGHGQQVGDPKKAAKVILKLTQLTEPPVHLLLGKDAKSQLDQKLKVMREESEKWSFLTTSTDYDN